MRVGTNSQPAVDISRSEVGKMKEYKKIIKKRKRRQEERLRMSSGSQDLNPGARRRSFKQSSCPRQTYFFRYPTAEMREVSRQNGQIRTAS